MAILGAYGGPLIAEDSNYIQDLATLQAYDVEIEHCRFNQYHQRQLQVQRQKNVDAEAVRVALQEYAQSAQAP